MSGRPAPRSEIVAVNQRIAVAEDSAEGVIQIRLDRTSQLFNMLDPFPFRERDLDADAEEHIVGWASELPSRRSIRIIVHLPQTEAATSEAQGIGDSLANFFRYRAETVSRELSELFRRGRWSLLIGLGVLGVCMAAAQIVEGLLTYGPLARFIGEGLIILGWVANWRPIEIFLYDWWPLAQRRSLFRRLAEAQVIVRGEDRVPRAI